MRVFLALLLLLIPIQASSKINWVTERLYRSQVTHVDTFRCKSGDLIEKTDYDRDNNGKDDATTYRIVGQEKPFAFLFGDTKGVFTYGIIFGRKFTNFGKLSGRYGSVCGAVRERQK